MSQRRTKLPAELFRDLAEADRKRRLKEAEDMLADTQPTKPVDWPLGQDTEPYTAPDNGEDESDIPDNPKYAGGWRRPSR